MRLLVVAALVACTHPHVDLPPPPPDLTPDQRVSAYEQLVGTHEHIMTCSNCVNADTHSVILKDGREIYYPEDLLPLVPPDSKTARHAERARSSRGTAKWSLLGGLGLAVGGFGLWYATRDDTSSGAELGHELGTAMIITGLIGAVVVNAVFTIRGRMATSRAYRTFNEDLATRLNVCTDGTRVVACEAQASPAP